MELKEVRFSDLSRLDCRFLAGKGESRRSILVVKFIGQYRDGSLGNPDATFMSAMVTAGLVAWEPSAVVIDLSQLKYVWGDMLDEVFPDDAGEIGAAHMPAALIVGDECRGAVRTLLLGVNSTKALSEVAWVKESLAEALRYVESRMGAT